MEKLRPWCGQRMAKEQNRINSVERNTFQDAECGNNDVRTGKVLHRKQDSVVNFVGTLHFFQNTDHKADRHELTQLVDEIKRCVVDTVPAINTRTTCRIQVCHFILSTWTSCQY